MLHYDETYVLLQRFSVARSGGFEPKLSKKVANVAHDNKQSIADVREYGLEQRRLWELFFGLVVQLLSHFRFTFTSEWCLADGFDRFRSCSTDSHFSPSRLSCYSECKAKDGSKLTIGFKVWFTAEFRSYAAHAGKFDLKLSFNANQPIELSHLSCRP